MSEKVPSVGCVVHFVNGGQHIPAIVTDPAYAVPTRPDEVIGQALTVFPVNEPPFTTVCTYNEAMADATWHWPEYVPAK